MIRIVIDILEGANGYLKIEGNTLGDDKVTLREKNRAFKISEILRTEIKEEGNVVLEERRDHER